MGGLNATDATQLSDAAALRPSSAEVWGIGLAFVTAICLSAVVGIAAMPLLSRRVYNRLLTFFVGLGVGSLSGSALFHLLPQAYLSEFSESGETLGHAYLLKAWLVVFGVYLFFLVDRLIRVIMYIRRKRQKRSGHLGSVKRRSRDLEGDDAAFISATSGDWPEPSSLSLTGAKGGSPGPPGSGDQQRNRPVLTNRSVSVGTQASVEEEAVMRLNGIGSHGRLYSVSDRDDIESMRINTMPPRRTHHSLSAEEEQCHAMCKHDHDLEFRPGQDSVIATVAWMVIFGDGLHNFVDGLSIGSSFTESVMGGISVSIAVLAEEFPHELGDVAILIASGMSLRQALTYNLLSAATCYLGFATGVLLGETASDSIPFVLGLAGGMFLYIALANMMPEMFKALELALDVSLASAGVTLGMQFFGVLIGLNSMFVLSYYQDSFNF